MSKQFYSTRHRSNSLKVFQFLFKRLRWRMTDSYILCQGFHSKFNVKCCEFEVT